MQQKTSTLKRLLAVIPLGPQRSPGRYFWDDLINGCAGDESPLLTKLTFIRPHRTTFITLIRWKLVICFQTNPRIKQLDFGCSLLACFIPREASRYHGRSCVSLLSSSMPTFSHLSHWNMHAVFSRDTPGRSNCLCDVLRHWLEAIGL